VLGVNVSLRVAGALVDGGARVERHSPLLPDLAEAATLYTQLQFSGSVARFPVEADEQLCLRPGRCDQSGAVVLPESIRRRSSRRLGPVRDAYDLCGCRGESGS
jgi:hypothetical protein